MHNLDVSGKPKIANVDLFELIGAGAMSRVYKGRQTSLDGVVAVKVLAQELLNSETAKNNFEAEAKLIGKLSHDNIVKLLGAGISEDGVPYLLLEYIEGQTLNDLIKEKAPLSYKQFRDIFLPLLSALEHAHAEGILHRDIKPSNIIVAKQESGDDNPKIVDFGIAKIYSSDKKLQSTLTAAALAPGTPIYMSPEQCLGQQLDARSDLYSLACVMYEALSGAPLFSSTSALEAMYKHTQKSSSSVLQLCQHMEVPESLARVLHNALSKDLHTRPASAAEFSDLLSRALNEITLDKKPHRVAQAKKQKHPIWILLLLAFVTVAGLSAILSKQENNQKIKSSKIGAKTASKLMLEGNQLCDRHKPEEAYPLYEEARQMLVKGGSRTQLAQCLYSLCVCLTGLKNRNKQYYEKLLFYSDQAENIYFSLNDRSSAFACISYKEIALRELGNKEELEKQAELIFKKCKTTDEKLAQGIAVIDDLRRAGALDKAAKLCDQYSALVEEVENAVLPGLRLQLARARILSAQGKNAKAIALTKSVASYSQKLWPD